MTEGKVTSEYIYDPIYAELSRIVTSSMGEAERDRRHREMIDLMNYVESKGIKSYRDFPDTEKGASMLGAAKRIKLFGDVPPEIDAETLKKAKLLEFSEAELKKAEAKGFSEAELGVLCWVTKMSAEEVLERTSVLKLPKRAADVIFSEIKRLPLGTPEGDRQKGELCDLMLYASSNGIRGYRDFPATEEGRSMLLLAKRIGMFGEVPPEPKIGKIRGAWLKARTKVRSVRQRVRDCRRAAKRAVDSFFFTPVGQVVGWIIRIAVILALVAVLVLVGLVLLAILRALIPIIRTVFLLLGGLFLFGVVLNFLCTSPEVRELERIERKLDRISKSK